MKQIAAKLGLSADASEDAILGELAKVMNRATEAEGKVKPLETEVATLKNRLKQMDEESADAELDAAGIAVDHADRAVIRQTLIANREGGRALLKLAAKPANQQQSSRVTNRSTAKTPVESSVTNEGEAQKNADVAARVSNRAKELQATAKANGGHMNWPTAFNKAKAEITKENK